MREVDSSETSVVWPAWCYSGETVNEDLPQATPASLLHQHQQRFLLQHQHQQQQQQSSSNQSQPSSSSSPSSASSSPSHLVAGQGAGKLSTRRRSSSGGKRKSITSTSPGPQQQHPTTALTAALGAGSVSAALATAAAAAAAAAAFQTASPRRSNPPTPTSTGLQLAALVSSENGNGCRGSPSSHRSTPTHDDGGHYSPLNNHIHNNNNNNISSSNFNNQVVTLQSLDKMLSERMYDRKKFLNSPTAGSAVAAAAAAAAASSFYEKLRNGAAEMELSQLNLIKNGQSPLAGSDLSAIGSNNNGSNSGSGSANGGAAAGGLLVTANGTSSSGGNSASVADGNSGNSLSNSSNQNSSNVHNASSSSSTGSIGNNSNNNSIKSERFSPTNNDVQSTASRSRSVTPSSFSGTPPQTMHATDVAFPSSISTSGLLPSPNSAMAGGRHEFQARNYSDIMRSLAAKYHNNNNSPGANNSNDPSSVKNPFLEPKMRINQPKPFPDGPLLGSKKSSPITSTQVPNPSIMSSLFPGLPFQSSVFPPLIDMSSTQALVALARAAKESGIHNLLKPEDGGLKKPAAGSRGSSPPLGATSLASHFPSPFPPRYLPGLLPNHLSASYPSSVPPSSTTAVPAISPLKSPTRPTEGLSTFPLDLSSAAGGAPSAPKRIKLSPTPSRNQETSPAPSSTNSQPSDSAMELKLGLPRKCHARIEEISAWTVDNVCEFVGSIDICAEYVQNFRDQSIDGAGLPLLTEEHLTNSLGMKLGPALKLKSMLAKKLGGPCPCALCAAPTPTRSSSSKGDTTPTNRPPSNGSVG